MAKKLKIRTNTERNKAIVIETELKEVTYSTKKNKN